MGVELCLAEPKKERTVDKRKALRHESSFERRDAGGRGQPAATVDDPAFDAAAADRLSRSQFAVEQVQLASEGELVESDPAAVKQTAAQGLAGSGSELPHLDRIQASFGKHDVGHVRAHVGDQASQAASAIGARAYASGDRVAFREQPDLHLAAHEAAHVVQQKGGVHLKDGVGQHGGAGDELETHADAVADKVVRGESAESMLDQTPGGRGAASDAVQMYAEGTIKGEHARIAETGDAAVVGEENYSQKVYATDALITQANGLLAQAGEKGSYLRLAKTGDSVTYKEKKLELVRPVFKPQGDAANEKLAEENKGKGPDETMSLWADCGRSSRVVMGSHGDAAPHATYSKGAESKETSPAGNPARYSNEIYLDAMRGFLPTREAQAYLKAGVHYNGSKENLILPMDADQARAQYWELGEDGRRMFDKYAGINTAANPEVGGGYTMNTEYNMPGFKGGRRTWNFHWAGVVMKAGSDNITLENYADGNGYDSVNMEWNYQMYGTVKKGQTFQEQHLASNTHGTRASTFAVKPDGD
jgi:hypothetical protein